MSDQAHRTLQYVEVIYFVGKTKTYKSRKWQHYPVEEAGIMYQRTLNKMKEEKVNCLVCLREENHQLIKSMAYND
jgi:hypothetical protein